MSKSAELTGKTGRNLPVSRSTRLGLRGDEGSQGGANLVDVMGDRPGRCYRVPASESVCQILVVVEHLADRRWRDVEDPPHQFGHVHSVIDVEQHGVLEQTQEDPM